MKNIIKATILTLMASAFVQANQITIETGALLYKKSPRLEEKIIPDAVWWRYSDGPNSWQPSEASTNTRNKAGYFTTNHRGEDYYFYALNNGYAQIINEVTGQLWGNTSTVKRGPYYSFRNPILPSNQEVEQCQYNTVSTINSTYFKCIGDKIARDLGIETNRQISSTTGLSNRIVMEARLECPFELLDDQDQMNWQVFKYNNGAYVEVSTMQQDWQFGLDDLSLDTDENNWWKYKVSNSVPYLSAGNLLDKTCEKKLCPAYFNPNTENDNICQMEVTAPKLIKEIPKKIFVIYPNTNQSETVYMVPNLNAYFEEGQNTTSGNDLVFKVSNIQEPTALNQSNNKNTLKDMIDEGPLKVEIITEGEIKKLKITIQSEINDEMANNNIYETGFNLTASENMRDFTERKLGVRLQIKVNILSSIYNQERQDLYRCQALTE